MTRDTRDTRTRRGGDDTERRVDETSVERARTAPGANVYWPNLIIYRTRCMPLFIIPYFVHCQCRRSAFKAAECRCDQPRSVVGGGEVRFVGISRARQIRNLSRAPSGTTDNGFGGLLFRQGRVWLGRDRGRAENERKSTPGIGDGARRCVDDGPSVNATIPRTACAVSDGGWCRSLSRHGVSERRRGQRRRVASRPPPSPSRIVA